MAQHYGTPPSFAGSCYDSHGRSRSLHEILRNLPVNSNVLDLGSKDGSFAAAQYPFHVFRLDLKAPSIPSANFVIADAGRLPFRTATFRCIVANHSLEHIAGLPVALAEIRRVLHPKGSLYVAVPDATTFSDRLYRWLAHGGGHINAFTSMGDTAALIGGAAGVSLTATRPLLSSFSFANSRNERWSRRIALLGWGNERFLAALSYSTRRLDSLLGTRWSHYGWAFYFGPVGEPVPREIWANVCVRCGSAEPASVVQELASFRKRVLWPAEYRCPACGALNLYTHDPPAL